jgi:hypothetical protein
MGGPARLFVGVRRDLSRTAVLVATRKRNGASACTRKGATLGPRIAPTMDGVNRFLRLLLRPVVQPSLVPDLPTT